MKIRKKMIQTVGAGALLALSAGGAQAALVNGTWEANEATGGDVPCTPSNCTGWTTFETVFTNATDGPAFGPVSHDAGGTQSMKVYGPFSGTGSAAGAFQSDNTVVAGQEYVLTAWAMNWVGDPMQNLGILQLTFWDGPNGTGNQLGAAFEQTADPYGTADVLLSVQDGADISDWSQLSVSGVAPAGTQSAKAFLLHIQTADPCCAGGSMFMDDVSLTAVPVPAAVWLFGSGILGLVGVARRRKQV